MHLSDFDWVNVSQPAVETGHVVRKGNEQEDVLGKEGRRPALLDLPLQAQYQLSSCRSRMHEETGRYYTTDL